MVSGRWSKYEGKPSHGKTEKGWGGCNQRAHSIENDFPHWSQPFWRDMIGILDGSSNLMTTFSFINSSDQGGVVWKKSQQTLFFLPFP